MKEDASRDQGRKAGEKKGGYLKSEAWKRAGRGERRKEEITGCSREKRKESKGETSPAVCAKS